MAEMLELRAKNRDTTGSTAARKMRKDEIIPGIVYGGNKQPQSIAIERKMVWRQLETGHFLSTVYMLDIEGEKIRVIPRAIQLDPVRDFPLHVDFLRVSKSSRLDVEVMVQFTDEEKSPGLKRGGVLNIVRHTVELSCPADAIPESIEISLAGLDIGDSVHISAVTLPANVTPTIADRDFTIATIATSSAMKPEAEEGVASDEAEASE
ncbi:MULTISPECIES: 50S ribosomal protein L25/general stress protein Ctc [Rhodomicrobium]|uniref:50S ribosomal protein L25/general stress protein Ctc n=1 Tax=Rhodomicrobium TaxID=1068 RepID=UPI000B4B6109|nr:MULTISPECIES: 50S ribosomal protein L25/general stress protein Ctc [Rhodomicrobium]